MARLTMTVNLKGRTDKAICCKILFCLYAFKLWADSLKSLVRSVNYEKSYRGKLWDTV